MDFENKQIPMTLLFKKHVLFSNKTIIIYEELHD